MDRYLLKNIIIIILLLVNGFLLISLASRYTESARIQRETEEQLVELFAADGMTLDADIISQDPPPTPLSLSRDLEREQAVAEFFLGPNLSQREQSGDVYTYSSEAGVARFRSNGVFDVVGTPADSDGQTLCQTFCEEFSYDDPVFTLDENGSGTGVAICHYTGIPVFNCSVMFTLDHGTLMTVSGTLLPEEAAATEESSELLSAAAALTAFQQARRESYMVVSAVTDLYPCYELLGSTASALSLVPVWCVVTDTANYYVNCITGVVSSG